MPTCGRMQTDPYLCPCTKLKSKWIKDLQPHNLLEEKVGSNLKHIGTGDYFLNITLGAQILRASINK